MHWMTQTLNMLSGQIKLSDTQAAAAVLGLNFKLCSDTFSYLSCWDSLFQVEKKRYETLSFHKQYECDVYSSRRSNDDDESSCSDSNDKNVFRSGAPLIHHHKQRAAPIYV